MATDANSQPIGKDPDAGKDRGQEEKGATENEMLDSITDSMDVNLSKLQEIVCPPRTEESGVLQSMESQRVRQT